MVTSTYNMLCPLLCGRYTYYMSNLWKGFAQNSITKNGSANPPSVVVLPAGFPCETESLFLPSSRPPDQFFQEVKETKFITRQLTDKFAVTYPIRFDEMRVANKRLVADCRVFSGWANLNKLQAFIENGCSTIDDDGEPLTFFLSDKGVLYYRRD